MEMCSDNVKEVSDEWVVVEIVWGVGFRVLNEVLWCGNSEGDGVSG